MSQDSISIEQLEVICQRVLDKYENSQKVEIKGADNGVISS